MVLKAPGYQTALPLAQWGPVVSSRSTSCFGHGMGCPDYTDRWCSDVATDH
jgi:hypothetical protein